LLTRKTILLISPDFWGINFNSKHHYAINLADRKNKVYFLNPPTKNNKLEKIQDNLWLINYKSLVRGLRFMPVYISGIFVDMEIKMLEKRYKIKFDIIWNFDTSRFFNLSHIKDKLKIAHIVDWSENFNRKILSKSTDVNLCTSRFLESELRKNNQHSYNIGHGYSPSSYKLTYSEKERLRDGYLIKAGYVGNLMIKYLDWKIFYNLIKKNSTIGFYFLGPVGKSNLSSTVIQDKFYYEVRNLENAIFLDEIPSKKIPAYLKNFDILLLIYEDKGHSKQLANPHKVLEYLASGRVMLSSFVDEYSRKDGLIEMVEKNIEFQKKFEEILLNLEFYNSKNLTNKREHFALKNTYSKKIREIESIIENTFKRFNLDKY